MVSRHSPHANSESYRERWCGWKCDNIGVDAIQECSEWSDGIAHDLIYGINSFLGSDIGGNSMALRTDNNPVHRNTAAWRIQSSSYVVNFMSHTASMLEIISMKGAMLAADPSLGCRL